VFGDAGLDSVRVKAHSDRPLFIGIARAAALERYLRGTEHDQVSWLTYHPFQVDYDDADGHTLPRAPVDESLWVKSANGAGSLALNWKPRPGDWRAVVMNADGSPGVAANLQFGARTSLLWRVGVALVGLASSPQRPRPSSTASPAHSPSRNTRGEALRRLPPRRVRLTRGAATAAPLVCSEAEARHPRPGARHASAQTRQCS
jgi:hypothetical protein